MCASQDAGPRQMYFSSPNAQILTNQAVIKELNLSTDQADRLRATFVRLQMEQRKLDDTSRFKMFQGAAKDFEEYDRNLVEEQRRSLRALEDSMKRRDELRQ